MVLIVPKVYYGIKNECRAEGIAEGKAIGERAERERTIAAMREAGFDEETIRRIEDAIARRAYIDGK